MMRIGRRVLLAWLAAVAAAGPFPVLAQCAGEWPLIANVGPQLAGFGSTRPPASSPALGWVNS